MHTISPYSQTISYTSISIHSITININDQLEYANITVWLHSDEQPKLVSCPATKSELDNWGEDDQFIISFVAQKLGLTLS